MCFLTEITRKLDHIDLGNQFARRKIHCWHFQSYWLLYCESLFPWKYQPLNFPSHRPCCFPIFSSITQANPSLWCFSLCQMFPRAWLKTSRVSLFFKFEILLICPGGFSRKLIKWRQIIVTTVLI